MSQFYQGYISALIHKPEIINIAISRNLDTKGDDDAEKAIELLIQSGLETICPQYEHWKECYSTKPPMILALMSYVTSKAIKKPVIEYIKNNFPEAEYLKLIYETIPPDPEVMKLKHAFGNVLELQIVHEQLNHMHQNQQEFEWYDFLKNINNPVITKPYGYESIGMYDDEMDEAY